MQIYYRKYRKIKRTKIIQSVLSPENKHVKHFVVFSLGLFLKALPWLGGSVGWSVILYTKSLQI